MCRAMTEETSSLVNEVINLRKELQIKEEESRSIRKKYNELYSKVENYENERKEDRDKIRRYKRTILKLNKMAKISVSPSNVVAVTETEPSLEINKESTERGDSPTISKKPKCKYENGGKCKEKNTCEYFHPKRTCQTFSKIGSCPVGLQCNRRHPKVICREWEENNNCQWNERCRFRHPLEKKKTPFLGGYPKVIPKIQQQHQQHQPPQLPSIQKLLSVPMPQPMTQTILPLNNEQYNLQFPPIFNIPPPQIVERMRRQF